MFRPTPSGAGWVGVLLLVLCLAVIFLGPMTSSSPGIDVEVAIPAALASADGADPPSPVSRAEATRRILERARLLVAEGRYAEAVDLARPLFDGLEALEGEELALAGDVVRVLAKALHSSHRDLGHEDRDRLRRVLDRQQEALGGDHPALADVLVELGCVLTQGQSPSSELEALYRRAIAIQDRSGRVLDAARTRDYLGILLFERGEPGHAMKILREALDVLEARFGTVESVLAAESVEPGHALLAEVAGDIAALRASLGEQRVALEQLRAARELAVRVLGPAHPLPISHTFNEVDLRLGQGRPEDAIELLRGVLEGWSAALGEEHFYIGVAHAGLGRALFEVSKRSEARHHFELAESILERALGPAALRTAMVRRWLGLLAWHEGRLTEAREWTELALAALDVPALAEHPLTATTLDTLARLLHAQGESERAFGVALRAEQRSRRSLRSSFDLLAESQALYMDGTRPRGSDTALTVVADGGGRPAAIWDQVVRSRALVLDEMIARQRLAGSGEGELASPWKRLVAARQRLAAIHVRSSGGSGSSQRLAEAIEERDRAEAALAEVSSAYRLQEERGRAGLDRVLGSLPAKTALVAFVRYFDLAPASAAGAAISPSAKSSGRLGSRDRVAVPGEEAYMAFVATPGGLVESVPLGPAAEIDHRIARFREQLFRHSEPRLKRASEALSRAIWDPVAAALASGVSTEPDAPAGLDRIFIVPDGELHRVQWLALVRPDGRYWVEEGPVPHLLSAERDLFALGDEAERSFAIGGGNAEPPRGSESILVVGDVDFDAADSPVAGAGGVSPRVEVVSDSAAGQGPGRNRVLSEVFRPLHHSKSEARIVADLHRKPRNPLRVRELVGAEASEAAFRDLAPGSRSLHLATHGFFLGGASPKSPGTSGPNRAVAGESSPLLLSGLALAGANRRAEGRPSENDGILTAEEIASLDLRFVELAVLSACDTALGRAVPGEGVLGLRRALRLAGARALVMSLWPVDDAAAGPWMSAFYRARLLEGQDLPSAVRSASFELLRSRRQAGEDTHPYFWGPFASEGAWGRKDLGSRQELP